MTNTQDIEVLGGFVDILGEKYYRIQNYDQIPPFFMSVVSSADHWLFVATTGGLTAGRVSSEHALFPYYTVDRITENAENTGPKTILQVHKNGVDHLWEPFIPRRYVGEHVQRTLYKNVVGSTLIFEEVNSQLQLTFRYAWRTSERFGIVKTASLRNHSEDAVSVFVTDGLQNILPAHVDADTQVRLSVLLDAYKRTELDAETGLGLFSLSSRLTDLAEPSEALRANTVWQVGLPQPTYLLSSAQLDAIRAGAVPQQETDVRGERGAYFVCASLDLQPGDLQSWHLVAEVEQNNADVADLIQRLRDKRDDLYDDVEQDIIASTRKLKRIVGSADGLQVSGDPLSTEHHFANVLFNVMRGGTFADQYHIGKTDLLDYVSTHDKEIEKRHADFFAALPDGFTIQTLKQHADKSDDPNLVRLCYTYLPLTFSRRHGDPSRPWNRFSIHLKNEDGSPRLNYEGNWRDIFQNWEALAHAYPQFIEGMICVFLNATTPDGYNPYRITRDGVDWEIPEPENPWANIGYWSDHQIIYLQKLMEFFEKAYPGKLVDLLTRSIFSHADVPYRIKSYSSILQDADDTIEFDEDKQASIEDRVQSHGTDGKLLPDANGDVFHTSMSEKLLNLLLAKLVNFVPGGGIWMNTQRPEWNDANNALVGKGLSVVTICYLRRYVSFLSSAIAQAPSELTLTRELHALFESIHTTLQTHLSSFDQITNSQRRAVMDELGQAGSDYRQSCYDGGYSGETVQVSRDQLGAFLTLAQDAIDQTIHANRRDDALYHAYNTLHLSEGSAEVHHLQVMLEGQVAVLSSGLLSPDEALALLTELRDSALYRADQHSYILYPDRDLPGFVEKNTVEPTAVKGLTLVQTLVEKNDPRLIIKDVNGRYHFGGEIRNVRDVRNILNNLSQQPELAPLVEAESAAILSLFEQVFQHDQFTGRSGSFFAYEGLGSIYWHMVSKLLLAVQENVYIAAQASHKALPALIAAYYDIRAGLGFNKSPDVYGAVPLDPYSHTPKGKGAKQPGMTGMVKEEILTRLGELGIVIENGEICFDPVLLRSSEFLQSPSELLYWDADGNSQQIDVPANAYALTLCCVPVIVQQGEQTHFVVHHEDGSQETVSGNHLGTEVTRHIFSYAGNIRQLDIYTDATTLNVSK